MTNSTSRQPIHQRSIEHRTWLLDNGDIEIESTLVDKKQMPYTLGKGKTIGPDRDLHNMLIRMVVTRDWQIRQLDLEMKHTPYTVCREILSSFRSLQGESLYKGWNALLSERFGKEKGCRHIVDLLRAMATVVFQSNPHGDVWSEAAIESLGNSCHVLRTGGDTLASLVEKLGNSPSP